MAICASTPPLHLLSVVHPAAPGDGGGGRRRQGAARFRHARDAPRTRATAGGAPERRLVSRDLPVSEDWIIRGRTRRQSPRWVKDDVGLPAAPRGPETISGPPPPFILLYFFFFFSFFFWFFLIRIARDECTTHSEANEHVPYNSTILTQSGWAARSIFQPWGPAPIDPAGTARGAGGPEDPGKLRLGKIEVRRARQNRRRHDRACSDGSETARARRNGSDQATVFEEFCQAVRGPVWRLRCT